MPMLEGQSIREGIIQQPSPFFNSNPSSCIWGTPPTPPLWRDAPSFVPPFSSSSSSSSFSFSTCSSSASLSSSISSLLSSANDQKHHHHQQPQQQRALGPEQNVFGERGGQDQVVEEEEEEIMDEKFRIAVGAGSSRGRQERSIDSAAMPSSSSPFSFGFPSQSSSSVLGHQHTTGSESSQPSLSSLSSAWRPSLYGLGVGLRPASDTLFGEAETKASSGPSPFSAAVNIVGRTSVSRFTPPDQRSAFDFSHGMSSAPAEASETWGQGLGLGNGQLFSSTSSFSFPPPSTMPSLQQSTTCPLPAFSSSLSSTATNAAFQAVAPKSSVPNGICNDAAGWRTIGSDTRYELRDTPFSLGANGVPPSIEQKDVDTVFVFGASGGSGTGPRSGNFDSRAGNLASKHSAFPVPGVTSRSRFARIKKHLNAIKGKVPTAVFRSGAGQPASEYSKASGFSGTGTDTGATQFCNTEFLSSLDINRASTADSFIGNNNQHRKSKQEPPHVPPWSKLQAASGYHSSWNHNLSSMGNDQHPSVHDSQAKALKGGKKETGETHSMHDFNQHFSFWNPFTQNRHEEVSDGAGVRSAQSSNQGVCFKSGGLGDLPKVDLVDSVSSEEHVADLIAGIANGENPFGRQRPAGRFNPFVGDGGLNLATKSSGILDGGNFSQAEAAVKESHVSGSQDGQSDPCLDRINLSPAKQDDTYEALFQHFSKLGPFVASPDGCKENQEPKSINVSTKQSQEPLIFRASKSNPSAANAERVEPTTGFGGFNAPGIPLASSGSKHDNEVFESVNSDVLGGSKSTIINDFSDKLARSRSATPSILSSNSGVKFEAGCVNGVNDSPLSSVFSQPFVFSAGSGADSHISNASPVWSMPQDLRQFDTGGVHERVPVAEFAGPASSSESSGSGCLPSRVNEEQWTETEISSGASHSFMSWASNEGRNGVGISRRKKDKIPRISSSNRRQRKQLYSKANMKSNGVGVPHVPVSENFDRGGSPMDFSPVFEAEPQATFPLGGSYNLPNVEQTSSFWGATMQSGDSEADYRDEREHLAEGDPRVEELRAAAANLSIGNEEGTYVRHTFDEGSQNSNGEHVSWSTSNFPSHRSGKWKRAALEEEKIAFVGFENAGLHAQREKYSENEVEFGDGRTADDGSIHQGQFKFTANFDPSSSSMMPRRRSRRIHREKAAGTIIDVGKTGVSRSDIESFPSMCPETSGTAGPGNKPGAMAAASAQAISNNFLLTFDVNTIEKVRTSGVFQADVCYSSADTAGQEKNVPAFPLQGTNLSATDSLHRSETGVPASPRAVKAEQACERWRLRGNQAYANGDFPKAEEYYSRGASSVSPNETSQSCIRASMLCYSNRAATRMAVGRMREALVDCMRAIAVDPSFTRVRLRAASCHLSLGESKAAAAMFKECLKYANEGDKPDSKTAAEASDGMKRAQQLDDYSDRASELLGNDNTADATAALRLLNEALLISPNSERLLEMKAQAFLSLRRFEEVIQLCEQSLASAERNHVTVGSEPQQQVVHNSKSDAFVVSGSSSPLKLWRWRMTAKSLFHLGRLEDSLDLLTKHEEARATLGSDKISDIGSGSTEALASFIANIRDLLHHKAAGNEAFQTGKHAEAVEHYTAAMACNGESRPFIAVCFCNRAAASQALGHIADAIADCSRAIALDPNYPKAISRRATLHEMVRDYGQACHDLRRFLELLENHQQQGKSSHRGRVGNSNSNAPDLRQARDRIAKAEDEMKKGHPLDHYLILGVDPSCSANEIKKAYRKAALKHHPDKAGQFLVRGENGDDAGVWKEVGDDLRRDAERLFKMIGEAYAILSDPTKRLRYDTDEELRKLRTRGGSGPTSGMSEPYHNQYEKGGRRHRERWDSWTGYAHQYQRWQSGPDAAQPDTYARRGSYTSNGSKSSGDGSRNAEFDWDGL